jgi:flagellar biosynthesis chaperone FliJ
MPKEESIVSGSKVKYKGNFDLELLYSNLRDWFILSKFSDPCKDGESKYSERVKPNGKQIEILWKVKKEEEDGYFLHEMDLSFFINGLNEVETEKNGKKIKINSGDIEITFNSKFTENANNSWIEDSFMHKLYRKMGLRDRAEASKIELYKDTMKIMDEVKSFFNLYRF